MRSAPCGVIAIGAGLLLTSGCRAVAEPIAVTGSPVLPLAERQEILRLGRAAVEQLLEGEVQRLAARFTPEMARQVAASAVAQGIKSVTGEAPVEERLGESVRVAGTGRVYSVEYGWKKNETIVFTIVFAAAPAGSTAAPIAGLSMTPTETLPEDPRADYKMKTVLRLPFAPGDTWYVFWGGPTRAQNYHVIAPDQRHAYDFASQAVSGGTHSGDGKRNEQFAAWGKTIVAPAVGTVVEAVDGVPDNIPGVMNRAAPAGNHIVLNFGSGEYALLAHLQQNSIRVHVGDTVKSGQVVGRCGNSGNSSEPHLHFHVQDKAALFAAEAAKGLPLAFANYRSGSKTISTGTPLQGDTLETLPAK